MEHAARQHVEQLFDKAHANRIPHSESLQNHARLTALIIIESLLNAQVTLGGTLGVTARRLARTVIREGMARHDRRMGPRRRCGLIATGVSGRAR
jgi:glycine/serine hydroxymethyltransferase